jgi:hypothetical protein
MRELRGKGKNESGFDTGGGEEFEFLSEWSDQGKRGRGAKDADGVRIEGDGERAGVELARATNDLLDDHSMTTVNAIEVANGGYIGAEVRGKFVE